MKLYRLITIVCISLQPTDTSSSTINYISAHDLICDTDIPYEQFIVSQTFGRQIVVIHKVEF